MKLMFWRWHWTLINAINLNIHTFYSSTLFVFFYRHLLCFKRTEKEASDFFRVSYYSKAGIDNTCIMIKKNAYVLLKHQEDICNMCGSELFSGRSSKNNLFLSGEGGLSLIFWKLLGKLNNFILSTRSGPRLPRSAHRSECHLIMCTRQLLYAVVFLSACALWGGRNTIKYRKKIYTHVI